ncbi:MAG TPA: zf-HC2 domain-containing protein [Candidatus Acidoferrum sp.]|nr:zf-HC2 domain-containing protein [Candidatus Acidoferrum sp.]
MSDMDSRHPETELIAYLKDELPQRSRETVARHLDGCADCRSTLTDFRTLLAGVAATTAPSVAWQRYRAELRQRLESEAGRHRWSWWRRPFPVAVSAGLAAAVLALVVLAPSAWRDERRVVDGLSGFEEAVLGTRLDMLRQYPVVERLDLLEDLDVIRQLDGLEARRES